MDWPQSRSRAAHAATVATGGGGRQPEKLSLLVLVCKLLTVRKAIVRDGTPWQTAPATT